MDTLPLTGKRIVIDPGHGGKYTGAVGQTGLQEKDVNLDVSLQLQRDLVELGAEVRMTRTADTEANPGGTYKEDLQTRCDVANRWPADMFISVHSNSNTNREVNGSEAYHARNASSRSRVLARLVHQHAVDELGLKDNGVRQADFYVIKNTSMPGILLETAYISHSGDEAKLADPDFRARTAHAVAHGIRDYFAIEQEIKPDPGTPPGGSPPTDPRELYFAPGDPEEFLLAGAAR